MGRPKGFVPQACSECGNRGRHKVDCTRSGAKPSVIRITQPYKRVVPAQTHDTKDAIVEGGLPAIHSYVSLRQDYKCHCGELLVMGKQHWTDNNGRHLCMEHAGEVVCQQHEHNRSLTLQTGYATIAA